MRLSVKIVLLLLLIIVINAQAELEWEYVAPLQTARSGHVAVSYGGRIFVMGGLTHRGAVLNTIEIYDPDTDVWKDGPSLPIPLRYHNAVVANDTIYIFGGMTSNGRISNLLFKYVPDERITRGPDMPVPVFGMASVYMNGKILVMGGRQDDGQHGAMSSGIEFNIRSQSWSESQYNMNAGRSNFCLVKGGNTVLAFGGIDFEVVVSVERLGFEGWQVIARMPTPRGHFQAVALGDRVVIGGGVGQRQRMRPLSNVDLFINEGREPRWERLPEMLDTRADFAMAELGGYVYAIGGAGDMRGGHELLNSSVERLTSELSVSQRELPVTPKLISASPNPANGRVKFSFPENATSLLIVDLQGHIIESKTLSGQSTSWIWNAEPVPAGLYFYVIEFDKYTPKVIDRITVIK